MKLSNDTKLARKWACDERTIRNWRKAKAPLDDPARMVAWLTGRQTLPAGTVKLLESNRRRTVPRSPATGAALQIGGGAALARLEAAEAQAYGAFSQAVQSGDLHSVKAARENWLAVGESLRKFDAQILENRRQTGEEIPRAEVVRILNALANGWSSGLCAVADALHDQFHARPPVEYNSGAVKETLWAAFAAGLAAATVQRELPNWVIPSITAGTLLLEPERKVEALAGAFRQFIQMKAEIAAAPATQP
jgi:hypothetical protein